MREEVFWWIVAVAFVIVVLIGIIAYGAQASDCANHNGVLVRGAFGYECVSKAN